MSTKSTVLSRRPRLAPALAARLAIAFALAIAEELAGQRSLPVELRAFNRLANSAFVSAATTANLPLPQWRVVAGATNDSPIVVATTITHGLSTGDRVVIKGVTGNEAANGVWAVTVRTETSFALDGSIGSGVYGGGGSIFPTAGQPVGGEAPGGSPAWTPWFSGPAEFPPTEYFRTDGATASGEVYSDGEELPVTSFLTQEIAGDLFRPGERLCLSIEARVEQPANDRQSLILHATAAFSAARDYRVRFPASALSTEFRRYALCFALDDAPIPREGVLRVGFAHEMLRGGGRAHPMHWARPMLNEGFEPAPWTPAIEPLPRTRAFRDAGA